MNLCGRTHRYGIKDSSRRQCPRCVRIKENIEKWDKFYLNMAEHVSTASKDPSTKCGCVIARPDKTVASVGYNGFPKGMNDDPELYADRDYKYDLIVHAEMNAIIHAKESLKECALYIWPFLTCHRCAKHIIQTGITRIVTSVCPPSKIERWEPSFKISRQFFKEAGIEVKEYLLHDEV